MKTKVLSLSEVAKNSYFQIKDSSGREFRTLRLSLLSVCNFFCIYCKTDDDSWKRSKIQPPSFFLEKVKILQKYLRIEKVHITGGEPTLYPDLISIIKGLKQLNIKEISITTNGTLILNHLQNLQKAGLDGINLSLDAIDNGILKTMGAKKNIQFYQTLIKEILQTEIQLKINTTILRGINDTQILPVLEFCGMRNIPVRFLEYMMMGVSKSVHQKRFFSQKKILETIQTKYQIFPIKRKSHATAKYWITNTNFIFGIIANHSEPFCFDCDRLRMDSDGKLYGCITQVKGFEFPDEEKQLPFILKKALQKKQNFFKGNTIQMHQIGG